MSNFFVIIVLCVSVVYAWDHIGQPVCERRGHTGRRMRAAVRWRWSKRYNFFFFLKQSAYLRLDQFCSLLYLFYLFCRC